jgi:hypothetical protein
LRSFCPQSPCSSGVLRRKIAHPEIEKVFVVAKEKIPLRQGSYNSNQKACYVNFIDYFVYCSLKKMSSSCLVEKVLFKGIVK